MTIIELLDSFKAEISFCKDEFIPSLMIRIYDKDTDREVRGAINLRDYSEHNLQKLLYELLELWNSYGGD